MKFAIIQGDTKKHANDLVIVGVFENNTLSFEASHFDKALKGHLRKVLSQGDIEGKVGQTLLLPLPEHKLLLVGCGKNQILSARDYRKIIFSSFRALAVTKAKQATLTLANLNVENRDLAWKVKQAILVASDSLYRFDQFKSEKTPLPSLRDITFKISEKTQLSACQTAIKEALAITKGIEFSKNLANMPSNICTPIYVAQQALELAKEFKNLSVKVLERKDMEKLGMGAFLAVAKGSAQPPKLVCIEYNGVAKKAAPTVLVGKGITFDTGGISLKPGEGMIGMKYDMCGAAAVLGTIKAAAELKLPLNVVGILALTENMPSGTATKPEDIVTTMSGQTVEILNTDAEGRLVLCDALTYCERYKPETVIDIATLTGAVVVALGHHATALLSNNDDLRDALLAAGDESFDRAWPMPLWEEYQELIRSPFADMTNTGGRYGGTITAGCFLSRFTKKFKWAHLDVAGTAAMMAGVERYATGRPVPLLMQYLINKVKK